MADRFVLCPAAATGCRLSLPAASGSRQRRPLIHEKFRGFADLGRFNLWRPMVVNRPRGSNRVQAQPAPDIRAEKLHE